MTTTVDHKDGQSWETRILEEALQEEGMPGIDWDATYLLPLDFQNENEDVRGTRYEEVADSDVDEEGNVCCPVFPADIVARKAEDRDAFMTLKPMPTNEMQNWGTVLFSVCVDDIEGGKNLTPEAKIVYKDAKWVTCPDYLASLPCEMEDGRIHQIIRVWAYVPAEGCVSMDAVVQTAARLEEIAGRHEHAIEGAARISQAAKDV